MNVVAAILAALMSPFIILVWIVQELVNAFSQSAAEIRDEAEHSSRRD